MALSKKKILLKKNLEEGKKTWCPKFLEYAQPHVFRFPKNWVFEGVFRFFDEAKPYFECFKAKDFRWN